MPRSASCVEYLCTHTHLSPHDKCSQILARGRILGAPVLDDSTGKYHGFLDIGDIMEAFLACAMSDSFFYLYHIVLNSRVVAFSCTLRMQQLVCGVPSTFAFVLKPVKLLSMQRSQPGRSRIRCWPHWCAFLSRCSGALCVTSRTHTRLLSIAGPPRHCRAGIHAQALEQHPRRCGLKRQVPPADSPSFHVLTPASFNAPGRH